MMTSVKAASDGSRAEVEELVRPVELVLVLTQVAGATAAGIDHGDEATLRVVRAGQAVFADAAAAAGGSVAKTLGEGLLLIFPPDRARDAVTALRTARAGANALWRAFDVRCEVQVKATVGTVLIGPLGPPGDRRVDVFGTVLNQLFKAPASAFGLSTQLEARL